MGKCQLCKQIITYNLQFFLDKLGKNYYINDIKIREVTTMASRTYHETEYTNTIAEVKKHFNKVCKKEGWLVSFFVWSKGEIDFKDTMMDVDIVTDIKDQNGRYIGVNFCYQPNGSSSYFSFHKEMKKNQCSYRNEFSFTLSKKFNMMDENVGTVLREYIEKRVGQVSLKIKQRKIDNELNQIDNSDFIGKISEFGKVWIDDKKINNYSVCGCDIEKVKNIWKVRICGLGYAYYKCKDLNEVYELIKWYKSMPVKMCGKF
jgi:hypothetical protein